MTQADISVAKLKLTLLLILTVIDVVVILRLPT